MKHRFIFGLLALLPAGAFAQEASPLPPGTIPRDELAADIRADVFRAGINTCPYHYEPAAETPVPRGYKPFYLSHYGRHGARTNWGEVPYGQTLALYDKAAAMGLLTPGGDSIRTQIADIVRRHAGWEGCLTPLGAREHEGIAERMYRRHKAVFRRGGRVVRAVSSISPRCIVSMAAATSRLAACDPRLDIRWDTGDKYMRYLFSNSTPQTERQTKAQMAAYRAAHLPDTAAFLPRVFTDPSRVREIADPVALMRQTLDLAHNIGAMELEPVLFRYFTVEDLCDLEECIAQEQYLRHCNSLEFGDGRMQMVDAFLADFVDKAEEAIAGGPCVADLRYGHDSHLMAIAARLGMEGFGVRLTRQQAVRWPGYRYTSFASNIQAVFYRNRKGEVLVKFYHDEREIRLTPLPGGPYYPWPEVKKFLGH